MKSKRLLWAQFVFSVVFAVVCFAAAGVLFFQRDEIVRIVVGSLDAADRQLGSAIDQMQDTAVVFEDFDEAIVKTHDFAVSLEPSLQQASESMLDWSVIAKDLAGTSSKVSEICGDTAAIFPWDLPYFNPAEASVNISTTPYGIKFPNPVGADPEISVNVPTGLDVKTGIGTRTIMKDQRDALEKLRDNCAKIHDALLKTSATVASLSDRTADTTIAINAASQALDTTHSSLRSLIDEKIPSLVTDLKEQKTSLEGIKSGAANLALFLTLATIVLVLLGLIVVLNSAIHLLPVVKATN